jgi:hypothetical protein
MKLKEGMIIVGRQTTNISKKMQQKKMQPKCRNSHEKGRCEHVGELNWINVQYSGRILDQKKIKNLIQNIHDQNYNL